jgi:hypothetical protein
MSGVKILIEDSKMAARYLVCLVLFGLFGCSGETVIQTKTEAQSKIPANISTSSTIKPTAEPVEVVGDFTNVTSDGEHQRGYSVQIWKEGDKILGLLSGSRHSRPVGDPPTGLLENAVFDAKTSELSFSATLPGSDCGEGKPAQDLFRFKGFLTSRKLSGNLFITMDFCNGQIKETEKITLQRSIEWSSEMDEYQSYEDWKKFADDILKFRGSKQQSNSQF